MTAPSDQPADPFDVQTRQILERIIHGCVYGDLATIEGDQPRVRPVCTFLQEDFTILVPSHTATRKTAQLAANPRVELCFVAADHWQVRVEGVAEVVDDRDVKRRLMETTLTPQLWHGFFKEGPSDPKFVLYRIRPRVFEWMQEWQLKYHRVVIGPEPAVG